MCSCSLGNGIGITRLPASHSVDDWLSSHLNELVNMTTISESALAKGDIRTKLFWVRCVDSEALREAFAKYNLPAITDKDLNWLADAAESGNDVKGFFKHPANAGNGIANKAMVFNVRQIVGGLRIESDKFNAPQCKVIYGK